MSTAFHGSTRGRACTHHACASTYVHILTCAWHVHGTRTGRVYADLLVNPLIVPLKMIKGAHKPAEHLGVMAVATRVHPQTPVRPAHT